MDTKRAVCFAVGRHEEFCAHQAQKSPVKINFFSVNKKFGNDDILLNSKSSINVFAKVDSFGPYEHDEETILSISQLQKIFTDQTVMIKATIKSLSGVKKLSISESSIDKKDLTAADPPGSIRVVLWGNYCEKEVVKDNTYIFKRFRYRSNKFGNCINTLKDGTCSIEECNSFKEFLAEADMAEHSEINERLTLLRIEKTSKTYICLKCSAKTEFVVSVTARCSNCKGLNKLKNCASNLYMKILFKNEKEEKLSLSLFHQTVLKMLALVNKYRDYQELSVEEIELAVAKIDVINTLYNCAQKNIAKCKPSWLMLI